MSSDIATTTADGDQSQNMLAESNQPFLSDRQKVELGVQFVQQTGDFFYSGIRLAAEQMQGSMEIAFELVRLDAQRAQLKEMEDRLRGYYAELQGCKSPVERKLIEISIGAVKTRLVKCFRVINADLGEPEVVLMVDELVKLLSEHAEKAGNPDYKYVEGHYRRVNSKAE